MIDDEGAPRKVLEAELVDGPLPPLEEHGPGVVGDVDPATMGLAMFCWFVLAAAGAFAEAVDPHTKKGRKR